MGLAVALADGGVNGPSGTSVAERIVVSGSASACSDSHGAATLRARSRADSMITFQGFDSRYGLMFWFTLNRLCLSYFRLIETSFL